MSVTGLLRFLGSVALLYLAIAGWVWVGQRRLMYLPTRGPVPLPPAQAARGLTAVELVASDGVRLGAWWWPGPRSLCFVLLHGNAGHRGDRLDWILTMRGLGASVLALDYRGYAESEGAPTEQGLISDGLAAVEWALERDVGPVVLVGESLGSGVAVAVASRRPPTALVLNSGFPSLVPVGRRAYPWLPVGLLMKDRFDCLGPVRDLRVPLLCIHGERDELVPIELGRALYEAAPGAPDEPGGKAWWSMPRAGHQEVPYVDLEGWKRRVEAFLDQNGLGA